MLFYSIININTENKIFSNKFYFDKIKCISLMDSLEKKFTKKKITLQNYFPKLDLLSTFMSISRKQANSQNEQ